MGLFDNTTKFESSVKQIPYSQEAVFRNISDLRNLEKVRDRVPEDKVQDFSFDEDTVSLNVAPVGELKLRIIEREEPKCVKFETAQSPVPFNVWIQVRSVAGRCRKDCRRTFQNRICITKRYNVITKKNNETLGEELRD